MAGRRASAAYQLIGLPTAVDYESGETDYQSLELVWDGGASTTQFLLGQDARLTAPPRGSVPFYVGRVERIYSLKKRLRAHGR